MWLINGTPADTVHAGDRGVHFGDGLFETMALDSGRVRLLAYHLERLEKGCRCLEIELPDRDLLRDEIDRISRGRHRPRSRLAGTARADPDGELVWSVAAAGVRQSQLALTGVFDAVFKAIGETAAARSD